jgi:hypothetical protein
MPSPISDVSGHQPEHATTIPTVPAPASNSKIPSDEKVVTTNGYTRTITVIFKTVVDGF